MDKIGNGRRSNYDSPRWEAQGRGHLPEIIIFNFWAFPGFLGEEPERHDRVRPQRGTRQVGSEEIQRGQLGRTGQDAEGWRDRRVRCRDGAQSLPEGGSGVLRQHLGFFVVLKQSGFRESLSLPTSLVLRGLVNRGTPLVPLTLSLKTLMVNLLFLMVIAVAYHSYLSAFLAVTIPTDSINSFEDVVANGKTLTLWGGG